MVQLLHPIDILAQKAPSSHRCTPLTRRRTLPTIRELTFSYSRRQNALERVAVRKITAQLIPPSHLPSPEPNAFSLAEAQPTVDSAVSVNFPPTAPSGPCPEPIEVPNTPPTPLEVEDPYQAPELQPEPKAGIFNNTTKSDALLDLTLAALHRIYVDDYNGDSWTPQPQFESQATLAPPTWPAPSRSSSVYSDQSPPSICGSAVSSAVSTPASSLTTPYTLSPEFDAEIAYQTDPGRLGTAPYSASAAPACKPIARTTSLPNQSRLAPPPSHSVLGDKGTLRWFLVELLRRSRASASVVQLALHYLSQARAPVGEILHQKFKSGAARNGTGQDDELKGGNEESPLLDPRRLLLAALMLSTKLLHDHAPNNRAWARVCGLPPRDVGACERALGHALDWKLANMFVGPADMEPVIA